VVQGQRELSGGFLLSFPFGLHQGIPIGGTGCSVLMIHWDLFNLTGAKNVKDATAVPGNCCISEDNAFFPG
jgi:hypothetical protein